MQCNPLSFPENADIIQSNPIQPLTVFQMEMHVTTFFQVFKYDFIIYTDFTHIEVSRFDIRVNIRFNMLKDFVFNFRSSTATNDVTT